MIKRAHSVVQLYLNVCKTYTDASLVWDQLCMSQTATVWSLYPFWLTGGKVNTVDFQEMSRRSRKFILTSCCVIMTSAKKTMERYFKCFACCRISLWSTCWPCAHIIMLLLVEGGFLYICGLNEELKRFNFVTKRTEMRFERNNDFTWAKWSCYVFFLTYLLMLLFRSTVWALKGILFFF